MDYRFLSWGFTVLFITLKLTNHIDWSWWLVFSPLIFSFLLILFLMVRKVAQLKAGGR